MRGKIECSLLLSSSVASFISVQFAVHLNNEEVRGSINKGSKKTISLMRCAIQQMAFDNFNFNVCFDGPAFGSATVKHEVPGYISESGEGILSFSVTKFPVSTRNLCNDDGKHREGESISDAL